MRLDFAFRLSTYLTLGLACVCLGYAEEPFLAEFPWMAAAMAGLLLIGFFVDGRWTLSVGAANVLAVIMAVVGAIWVAYHLTHQSPWLQTMPFPGAFLPFLGPSLLFLMLAKLFRPKQMSDYWWLQGMGLMAVALGSALTIDWVYGFLLLAYLTCGLWCLSLFYLHRQHQAAKDLAAQRSCMRPSPVVRRSAAPVSPALSSQMLGIGRSFGWTGLIVALGFILFLVTPRNPHSQWEIAWTMTRVRTQTGLGEAAIDLNRQGKITMNDEVAFVVEAREGSAEGPPKLDLSPEQRWRGMVVNSYAQGRWTHRTPPPHWQARGYSPDEEKAVSPSGSAPAPVPPAISNSHLQANLPDLGPEQCVLTIQPAVFPIRMTILAEPVRFEPKPGGVPVLSLSEHGQRIAWFPQTDGTLRPPLHMKYHYRQVIRLNPTEEAAQIVHATPAQIRLLRQPAPVPRIETWTSELLRRLVAEGRLADTDLEPGDDGFLLPQHHEKVARALEAYLATSGEFSYTLELQRKDLNLDPTEDFLVNVKSGHCERYAGALTLMLRTQGIASRVVLGYRGADSRGDGFYDIRQSHAHSWVEAAVPRPGAAANKPEFHWLMLDPTPGEDAKAEGMFFFSQWLTAMLASGQTFWRNTIVEYNAENQEALAAHLHEKLDRVRANVPTLSPIGRWFGGSWKLAGTWLAGLTLLGLGAWYLRRRWVQPVATSDQPEPPGESCYLRLLAILSRFFRLSPAASQTPREFGSAARSTLTASLAASAAAIPEQVIAVYYRVRYGGQPLPEGERHRLTNELDQLEAALARSQSLHPDQGS